jgi:hypothetical protein
METITGRMTEGMVDTCSTLVSALQVPYRFI